MINTEDETGKDIPEIIAGIILGAFQLENLSALKPVGSPTLKEENKETTNHLR